MDESVELTNITSTDLTYHNYLFAFHSLMSILNYLGFSLAQGQRGTIVIGNWLIDVLKKWTGRCMGFIILCEKKHRQLIK